jgi:hypothetical protein
VDAVGQPDVLAHPAPLVEQIDRPPAEVLEAVLGLLHGLAQVGVQPQPVGAGEGGRLDHQLGRDRERRARRDHDLAPVGIVEAGDHRLGRGEDGVTILHDVVGGQAAVALTQVHRAPGQDEADAHLPGRGGDGVEHRVVTPGDEVVVVGGGRATGPGQLPQAP